MKHNHNGFSAVQLVLMIVLVCIVGITALSVWKTNHPTPSTTSPKVNTFSVTYYDGHHCSGGAGTCIASGDNISADIKALSYIPQTTTDKRPRMSAQIIKLTSYQRFTKADYPMVSIGQTISLIVSSSTSVGNYWSTLCRLQAKSCHQGIVSIGEELPADQAANFINSLQNKTLTANLTCYSYGCFASITGQATASP